MTNEIETGGPAFPQKEPLTCDNQGMDLRDYFAAKAMQAYVTQDEGYNRDYGLMAQHAYAMADAMLAARK